MGMAWTTLGVELKPTKGAVSRNFIEQLPKKGAVSPSLLPTVGRRAPATNVGPLLKSGRRGPTAYGR